MNKPLLSIFLVFLGCCSNVVFLELLLKEDPGSGCLITFSQFLFIALEGFIFTAKFGTVKSAIKIRDYTILVIMFFFASVCNNYATNFYMPMPLIMIFRAGSLAANMIMGMKILKKKYVFSKYISVFLITMGIFICTIISAKENKSTEPLHADDLRTVPRDDPFWWILGITLLTVALFVSAGMGIYQEVMYSHYGKHAREALYYTHLLPIPLFLILVTNIRDHFVLILNSDPIVMPLIGISMPKAMAYLIGNVLTQYMCIRSVYVLTTECSSLTVTLVVTVRKFVSLIFSVVYFENPFTIHHWIGTALIFIGTIIFTEVVPNIQKSFQVPSGRKKVL